MMRGRWKKWKKWIFVLTAALLTLAVPAGGKAAETGQDGRNRFVIRGGILKAYWGESADVVIPEGVTAIGDSAFSGRSDLTSVTIPEGVERIGRYAFSGCSSLSEITFPQSLSEIGENAFAETAWLENEESDKTYAIVNGILVDGTKARGDAIIPEGVTGIAESAFEYCSGLTSVTIPEGITNIGDRAFYHCSGLTSVTIPGSVTNIGDRAFTWCSGLTSVTIQDGVTNIGESAFEWCSGLTSVTIPDSVTNIGSRAFWSCDSLTSVIIPESVTNIGYGAFEDCSSLDSVTLLNENVHIGQGAFSGTALEKDGMVILGGILYSTKNCTGDVVIPEGVTGIGDYAFSNCSGLTAVTIPESVTSIGDEVFAWCGNLVSVTIPEGVTSIGDRAFCACNSLASVAIPESVISIGGSAFSGCSSLVSVAVPKNVKMIGEGPFAGCPQLQEIIVASENNFYKSIDGCLYDKDTACLIQCPGAKRSAALPEGLEQIGFDAFSGCTGLASIRLPESLEWIGDGAFYGCTGLASIRLPEGLAKIGAFAFEGCIGLESVDIPKSVTSIGGGAFNYCENLSSVHISNTIENICDLFYGTPWLEAAQLLAIDGVIVNGRNCYGKVFLPEGTKRIAARAFYKTYAMPAMASLARNANNSLTGIFLPEGTTAIGDEAFLNNTDLKEAYIPSTVTDIAGNAFADTFDNNLPVTIYTEESAYAQQYAQEYGFPFVQLHIADGIFTGGSGDFVYARAVTLPGHVTSVGDRAFCGWEHLTEAELLDGVAVIGEEAFCGLSMLNKITIPESVTDIAENAFAGCENLTIFGADQSYAQEYAQAHNIPFESFYMQTESGEFTYKVFGQEVTITKWNPQEEAQAVIPDSIDGKPVTVIGENAFLEKENLTSVVFPKNLKEIRDGAFSGCTSVSALEFPEGLTSIGEEAFYGCTSLAGIRFPESLKEIGRSGFRNCSALKTAELKNSVSLPAYVFASCTSLVSCSVSSREEPGEEFTVEYGVFSGCGSLTGLTLPSGCRYQIGNAFSGCAALKRVSLGDAQISGNTFSVKENPLLETVEFSACSNQGCKRTIPSEAFKGFANLKCVRLSAHIREIGAEAFYGCSSLEECDLKEGLETIGDKAFYSCKNYKMTRIPSTVRKLGDWIISYAGECEKLVVPKEVCNYMMKNPDSCSWLVFFKSKIHELVFEEGCEGVPAFFAYGVNEFPASMVSHTLSVTLPATVKAIGNYAFKSTNLASVELPAALEEIGNEAFASSDLSELNIPLSVKKIGHSILSGTNVDSFTMRKGVTYGSDEENCKGALFSSRVKNVLIEDGVTEIPDYFFNGMSENTELVSLEIPDSVKAVGEKAFGNCKNLMLVEFFGAAPAVAADAFEGVRCRAVYIPGKGGWESVITGQYGGEITWMDINTWLGGGPEIPPLSADQLSEIDDAEMIKYWGKYQFNMIKYLVTGDNFTHLTYIESNDSSIGGQIDQKLSQIFFQGFDGMTAAVCGSGKLTQDAAEKVLIALAEEWQPQIKEVSEVITAKKFAGLFSTGISTYLEYKGTDDTMAYAVQSVLHSDRFSEVVKSGSYEKIKNEILKRLPVHLKTPEGEKYLGNLLEEYQWSDAFGDGLKLLNKGLGAIDMAKAGFETVWNYQAVAQANDCYKSLLTYLKDNAGQESIQKAAKHLLQVMEDCEGQIAKELLKFIGKQATEVVTGKISDVVMPLITDHFPFLNAAKAGLNIGVGLANLMFHTADTAKLKDSLRATAYIGRAMSTWAMNQYQLGLSAAYNPPAAYEPNDAASRAVQGMYMLLKLRQAGEETFQKLCKNFSTWEGKRDTSLHVTQTLDYAKLVLFDKEYIYSQWKTHFISCPVDVTVRDENGRIIASLKDGAEMTREQDGVFCRVIYDPDTDDYIKYICAPEEIPLTLEIQGTGTGTMRYMTGTVGDGGIPLLVQTEEIPVTKETRAVIKTDVLGEVTVISAGGAKETYQVKRFCYYEDEIPKPDLTPKDPTPKDPAEKDPTSKDPTPKDPAEKDPTPKDPAEKDPTPKDPTEKDPDIQEILNEIKKDRKNELETYKNAADYREAQKEELAKAIAAGKAAIDEASDAAAIDRALALAKAAIDQIKTDAQLTEEEKGNGNTQEEQDPDNGNQNAGTGNSGGSGGQTAVKPKKAIPKATSIKGKIKAKKKAFLVKWKKQKSVAGYQVQYSANKKFKKKASKIKTVKGASKTKLTIKKLKGNKKYYVRVRTFQMVNGTPYYSGWSKMKTVRTRK